MSKKSSILDAGAFAVTCEARPLHQPADGPGETARSHEKTGGSMDAADIQRTKLELVGKMIGAATIFAVSTEDEKRELVEIIHATSEELLEVFKREGKLPRSKK